MERELIENKKVLNYELKPQKLMCNFAVGAGIAVTSFVTAYVERMHEIWKDILIANQPTEEIIKACNVSILTPDELEYWSTSLALQSLDMYEVALTAVIGGTLSVGVLTGIVLLPACIRNVKLKNEMKKEVQLTEEK